jgi:hypothetical protein
LTTHCSHHSLDPIQQCRLDGHLDKDRTLRLPDMQLLSPTILNHHSHQTTMLSYSPVQQPPLSFFTLRETLYSVYIMIHWQSSDDSTGIKKMCYGYTQTPSAKEVQDDWSSVMIQDIQPLSGIYPLATRLPVSQHTNTSGWQLG